MQVVVRKPRIDVNVDGKGLKNFIKIIKSAIPEAEIIDDDSIDIDDWDYYKQMKARLTPATVLKIRRENAGLTQAQLAEKCGIAAPNISLMERGKRSIGIKSAKILSEALGCDPGDFVV